MSGFYDYDKLKEIIVAQAALICELKSEIETQKRLMYFEFKIRDDGPLKGASAGAPFKDEDS